jgi:hypothetical protein
VWSRRSGRAGLDLGRVESGIAFHPEMRHAPLGYQAADVPGTDPEVIGERNTYRPLLVLEPSGFARRKPPPIGIPPQPLLSPLNPRTSINKSFLPLYLY